VAIIAVGPEFAIDGPLPVKPRYTLVDATLITDPSPAVAEDVRSERWANGIAVHGYPQERGTGWGVCSDASPNEKDTQEFPIPLPEFGPLTVYLTETCSSPYIRTPEDFKARALAAFAAVESGAVAREFELGEFVPGNPHLGDANLDVLNGGAATSVADGIAYLESAIAETHRQGTIHMPSSVASALSSRDGGNALHAEGGKLYTINGTLVIPDFGYTGAAPEGQTAVSGSETWIYATGPVETLRTAQPIVIPEDISQALDRLNNTVEYRAERYYIPFWDTALQAGVLVDRCLDTCGT
jgi:hypothetical protein